MKTFKDYLETTSTDKLSSRQLMDIENIKLMSSGAALKFVNGKPEISLRNGIG